MCKDSVTIKNLIHAELFKRFIPSKKYFGAYSAKGPCSLDVIHCSYLKKLSIKHSGQEKIGKLFFIGGVNNSIFSIWFYITIDRKLQYFIYCHSEDALLNGFDKDDLDLFIHFLRIKTND